MARLFIILTLTFGAIEAVVCTCFFSEEQKWQKEIINRADIIFIGTARLNVPQEQVKFGGADSLVAIEDLVFEINEEFKGLKGKTEIRLSSHGCSASYKLGKQYLIFGYNDGKPKLLRTDNCGSYSENEHQGGTHIGPKYYKALRELVISEKRRLKF
jgi:hypothetical protein